MRLGKKTSMGKETSATEGALRRSDRMLLLVSGILLGMVFAAAWPMIQHTPKAQAIDSRCFLPWFVIGNASKCSVISDKNPYCENGQDCGVQAGIDETKKGLSGIATTTSIRRLVLGWLDFILQYAAFFAVIILVGAGIYLIFSIGNEAVFKKVIKIILYVVVGFIIILLSYAVINNVLRVLE